MVREFAEVGNFPNLCRSVNIDRDGDAEMGRRGPGVTFIFKQRDREFAEVSR